MDKYNNRNVVVLPAWYPEKENPVLGIFIKEQVSAISKANTVIVIYNEQSSSCAKFPFEIVSDTTENGIRTIRTRARKLPVEKAGFIIDIARTFAAFLRLVKEGISINVIHAHVFTSGVIAVLLGKLLGIPVAISEHWSRVAQGHLTAVNRLAAAYAFRNADAVICVSHNLKTSIHGLGVKKPIQVVPNTVDTSVFSLPDTQNQLMDPKIILFVGLFLKIKGIDVFIKAVDLVSKSRNDFVVYLVGDGPEREEQLGLINESRLNMYFRYLGLQPKNEVACLMKTCTFLVLPSYWENMPCVIIEAMACGKPVIATNVGGVPELVSKDSGIIVPSGDEKGMAEKICYLLDNYEEFSSEKIARVAKDRFSHEAIVKKLEKIYSGL